VLCTSSLFVKSISTRLHSEEKNPATERPSSGAVKAGRQRPTPHVAGGWSVAAFEVSEAMPALKS
jgi:hypothetical protein